MYFFYSLLLIVWGLLLLPVFLYKAWRRGKRLPGMKQRFGRLPEHLKSDGRAVFWFHSCSVGETLSLQPLVRTLRLRFPETRFVFSTITPTGQEIAVRNFGAENVFYFPMDFSFVVRRVLRWIRPSAIIIVDTEIWPNLLNQARRRGIPAVLVNGRISPSSFRWYRRTRLIWRGVFRNYAALMMQSEEDAQRISEIGAPKDKISVPGNLKFDQEFISNDSAESLSRDLAENFILTWERGRPRRRFCPVHGATSPQSSVKQLTGSDDSRPPVRRLAENFIQNSLSGQADVPPERMESPYASYPLIVAGSTHPGEEKILLNVLRELRRSPGLEQTRLLLAPRHPERFNEVADLAADAGFSVRRRSQNLNPESATDQDAQVLLLDTLGELAAIYRFADIVFVGGTLIRHGGHSILEPAAFARAIVIGPSMENFRAVRDEFVRRTAVRQIQAGEDDHAAQERQLLEVFRDLLRNAEAREALGNAALSVLEKNRGAARKISDRIAEIVVVVRHS